MSFNPANTRDQANISITESFIESTNRLTADAGSDYGDFGDEEELAIVEQLLSQVASKTEENASLIVTDIEDYEPPRGLRLPKVLGIEQTRRWEDPPAQTSRDTQTFRDRISTNSAYIRSAVWPDTDAD
jgi:hypothetical protein